MEGDGALEHTVEIQCMYLVRWISDSYLLPLAGQGKQRCGACIRSLDTGEPFSEFQGKQQPERWELGHLGPGSGPWPCLDHHTNSNCPEEMHLQ